MKRIELEEKSTYTRIELLQLNDKIKKSGWHQRFKTIIWS